MKIFKLLFLLLLLNIFSNCNSDAKRKNEIQETISSAGDFSYDLLSKEDKALFKDEIEANEQASNNYEWEKTKEKQATKKDNSSLKNRKLIKTGSIRYETDDIQKSRMTIKNLITKHNAFISNEESNNYDYRIEQNLSIRIPFAHFDAFVNELSSSVKLFDFKNINVKDVTEEYVDVQSRLKAKYKLEESFLALLKKALKIKDILEIEKELNIVRSDIESMEGRLRYLKDQVSLSTLNIAYYKNMDREYRKEKGFFAKLWYNFQAGFSGLLSFTLGIVSIWPFFLIVGTILFFVLRWWKKRKKSSK